MKMELATLVALIAMILLLNLGGAQTIAFRSPEMTNPLRGAYFCPTPMVKVASITNDVCEVVKLSGSGTSKSFALGSSAMEKMPSISSFSNGDSGIHSHKSSRVDLVHTFVLGIGLSQSSRKPGSANVYPIVFAVLSNQKK